MGISSRVFSIDQNEQYNLSTERVVLFIVSSTGEGDPPDSCLKFQRNLRSKTLPPHHFSHLHYTLLGLGDTNYQTYQGYPKKLDARLSELGAKKFYPRGEVDEAIGIEEQIEKWVQGLWPSLKEILKKVDFPSAVDDSMPEPKPPSPKPDLKLALPKSPPCRCSITFDPKIQLLENLQVREQHFRKDNPFYSKLIGARWLTHSEAVKGVIELELDLSTNLKNELVFKVGDSIGIPCPNNPIEVEKIITRLNLTSVQDIPFRLEPKKDIPRDTLPSWIPSASTIKFVFSNLLDLSSPPQKAFLRVLADNTSNSEEKQKLLYLLSLIHISEPTRPY
eukprot:TRINITY_DN5079_c0_g1_i2.p1 TRINITY_DN5079_c0_g1~~TRINITY_DN5079_c0_g1_i2.p1  ORF type:complete len:383 (-),score=78.34 TRINITY_DN5079_c0_g1_i2:5-1006(-)